MCMDSALFGTLLERDSPAQTGDPCSIRRGPERTIEHLEIGRELEPGRYGGVVKHLKALFIVIGQNQIYAVIGEAHVVVAHTEAVTITAGNEPGTSQADAPERVDDTRFLVGNAEPPKQTPVASGSLRTRYELLVEIVESSPGAVFCFKLLAREGWDWRRARNTETACDPG